MKKIILIVFTIFGVSMILQGEPYKPYPVLFIHGVGVSSQTWGVEPTEDRSDLIIENNIESGHTYKHFLEYMNPYGYIV